MHRAGDQADGARGGPADARRPARRALSCSGARRVLSVPRSADFNRARNEGWARPRASTLPVIEVSGFSAYDNPSDDTACVEGVVRLATGFPGEGRSWRRLAQRERLGHRDFDARRGARRSAARAARSRRSFAPPGPWIVEALAVPRRSRWRSASGDVEIESTPAAQVTTRGAAHAHDCGARGTTRDGVPSQALRSGVPARLGRALGVPA